MSYEELLADHLDKFRKVLATPRKHKLTCSGDKAVLCVPEVEFAGHVVGNGQKKPIAKKLACFEHWERPSTITGLRAFLGFCNYYSGYLPMYAQLAAPLHDLLKVGKQDGKKGVRKPVQWTIEAAKSFQSLKKELMKPLSLNLINPDQPFVLRTDSSDFAVGAVLEQVTLQEDGTAVHHPVAFWSRVLTPGQKNTWTPREKEAYAIVCALRKWAGHIGLQPVTVCTDHQSLQSWHKELVDTPSGPAGRRARSDETLAKFDLSVVYIPGKTNTIADCLSRWAYLASKGLADVSCRGDLQEAEEAKRIIRMEELLENGDATCFVVQSSGADGVYHRDQLISAIRIAELDQEAVTISVIESCLSENWDSDYRKSQHFRDYYMIAMNEAGKSAEWPRGLRLEAGKLFVDHRLVVPESRMEQLAAQWHEIQLLHPGQDKMYRDMQSRFLMPPTARKIISQACSLCPVCQACSWPNRSRQGEQEWAVVPDEPMQSVALDVFSMPAVKDATGTYDCVVVCVDRHSGYMVAVPALKKGLDARAVAGIMSQHWLTAFGIPATITSDSAPNLVGEWFRGLCDHLGIYHATTVAHKSRTKGRAEVAGKQLFERLRRLHITENLDWLKGLWRSLQAYHDLPTPSGLSPHQILFTRDRISRTLPWYQPGAAQSAQKIFQRADEVAAKVSADLNKLHEKQNSRQKQGPTHQYGPGDHVWVERPEAFTAVKGSQMRYHTSYTPGIVRKRLRKGTYLVQTSEFGQKKRQGTQLVPREPDSQGKHADFSFTRPMATSGDDDEYLVDRVLKRRKNPRIPGGFEYLTSWTGYGRSHNTWEAPSTFLPKFNEAFVEFLKSKGLDVSLADALA